MPLWSTAVIVFVAWSLSMARVSQGNALHDARRGKPPEERSGTSCIPFIPMVPLFFVGAAWLGDKFASPWSGAIIASLHSLMALELIVGLVRGSRELDKIDNHSQPCDASGRRLPRRR